MVMPWNRVFLGGMGDRNYNRLEVVDIALNLVALSMKIPRVPVQCRKAKQHLDDALDSIVLNLSKGAGKFSTGEKLKAFRTALGEFDEVKGALSILLVR